VSNNEWIQQLDKYRKIYLAYDNDDAGIEGALQDWTPSRSSKMFSSWICPQRLRISMTTSRLVIVLLTSSTSLTQPE